MNIALETVLRRCSGMVSRSLDDARIALRLERSETLVFNATADRLWDAFDGRHTVAQVAAAAGLKQEMVLHFARELVGLDLFEIAPEAPPTIGADLPPIALPDSLRHMADLPPIALPDSLRHMAPQLVLREDLQVFGGCTSATTLCITPSSTLGNGSGNGNPNGPPKPPPGRNK